MVVPEDNKQMFNSIAHGYDKTNDIITLGRHQSWYRLMARLSASEAIDSMVDCATGTGNVAIAFKKYFGDRLAVTAIDVAENMLGIAQQKAKEAELEIDFVKGDILNMPFADGSFDLATISFGIRNTESIEKCLVEMSRVVRTGGKVMILETGRMSGIKKLLFAFYQKIVVRFIGIILTGSKTAYDYFVDSSNNFPSGKEFIEIMRKTGCFAEQYYKVKMFGTIFLYVGKVK